jgi:LAO/AO transport system kinase
MTERNKQEKPSTLHVMPGVDQPSSTSQTNSGAKRRPLTVEDYVEGVLSGDRTRLGQAITLVESNSRAHFEQAREVVKELLPKTGNSIRIGITGVPGAGKSTFIEALGNRLIEDGHRVAVTAVDPSSTLTGGSIMGDKTRMETLAANERAFIRPSPSGGALGGVARKTRETILLFEAAGYDIILVETIGVGQSEIAVRSLVDFFLLTLVPGAGDELQGLKKGVVELADAILINKADGDNVKAAERAQREYENALHYLTPTSNTWTAHAYTASSTTGDGIAEIWDVISGFTHAQNDSGELAERRKLQARDWVHDLVQESLTRAFARHPDVKKIMTEQEDLVMEGRLPATSAALELLKAFGVDALED